MISGRTFANPQATALAGRIYDLTEAELDRPTKADRAVVVKIREEIRALQGVLRESGSEEDRDDGAYLYVEGTKAARRQDDFYATNGNKWADAVNPANA